MHWLLKSLYIWYDKTNNLSSRKENISDDDVGIIDKDMKKLTLKESTAQDNKKEGKEAGGEEGNYKGTQAESLPKEWRYAYDHPKDQIIDDPSQRVRTHASLKNINNYLTFVS